MCTRNPNDLALSYRANSNDVHDRFGSDPNNGVPCSFACKGILRAKILGQNVALDLVIHASILAQIPSAAQSPTLLQGFLQLLPVRRIVDRPRKGPGI